MQEKNSEENLAPKINNDNVDDILTDMLDNIPDIQPHVVDNVNTKNKETVKEAVEKSKESVKFNPDIHATRADGSPSVTPKGKFRKKAVPTKKLNDPYAANIPPPQSSMEVESHAAAVVVQDLKRSAYSHLLGCEYGADRHKIYIDATTGYFVSGGGVRLSPLHTLLILEGALLIEAMGKPKAIDKITKFKIWAAEKFIRIKSKKKVKNNDAQPDSRPVNERKDDTSEVAGEGHPKQDRPPYFSFRPKS